MKTLFIALFIVFTLLSIVFNYLFFWFFSGFFGATALFVIIGKAQTKKIQKQWDKRWELINQATNNEA